MSHNQLKKMPVAVASLVTITSALMLEMPHCNTCLLHTKSRTILRQKNAQKVSPLTVIQMCQLLKVRYLTMSPAPTVISLQPEPPRNRTVSLVIRLETLDMPHWNTCLLHTKSRTILRQKNAQKVSPLTVIQMCQLLKVRYLTMPLGPTVISLQPEPPRNRTVSLVIRLETLDIPHWNTCLLHTKSRTILRQKNAQKVSPLTVIQRYQLLKMRYLTMPLGPTVISLQPEPPRNRTVSLVIRLETLDIPHWNTCLLHTKSRTILRQKNAQKVSPLTVIQRYQLLKMRYLTMPLGPTVISLQPEPPRNRTVSLVIRLETLDMPHWNTCLLHTKSRTILRQKNAQKLSPLTVIQRYQLLKMRYLTMPLGPKMISLQPEPPRNRTVSLVIRLETLDMPHWNTCLLHTKSRTILRQKNAQKLSPLTVIQRYQLLKMRYLTMPPAPTVISLQPEPPRNRTVSLVITLETLDMPHCLLCTKSRTILRQKNAQKVSWLTVIQRCPGERIATTGRMKKWMVLTMMEVEVPRAHQGLVDRVAMVELNTERMDVIMGREEEGEEGEQQEKQEGEEEKEEKEEETITAMMMMKVLMTFRQKTKTSRMRKYSTILLKQRTVKSDPLSQQVQFPAPLPHPLNLKTKCRTVKQCQYF